MAFVSKLSEAKDKNGQTYFWGYLNLALFTIKIVLFKSKKEDESDKWNMFWEEKKSDDEKQGN